MMIISPLWGIWDMQKQQFAQRFLFCYLFIMGIQNVFILIIYNNYNTYLLYYLVVGFGSWAFHMTLLYEMQLFDELPMVWGTCYCIYCL